MLFSRILTHWPPWPHYHIVDSVVDVCTILQWKNSRPCQRVAGFHSISILSRTCVTHSTPRRGYSFWIRYPHRRTQDSEKEQTKIINRVWRQRRTFTAAISDSYVNLFRKSNTSNPIQNDSICRKPLKERDYLRASHVNCNYADSFTVSASGIHTMAPKTMETPDR